jgi:hypothetical protein
MRVDAVEVRARILAEHGAIRGMLVSLDAVARRVATGERPLVGPLRVEGETLLKRFGDHVLWEDFHLVPLLRGSGAWGAERAAHLDDEHREQRRVLEHCLAAVLDPSRPVPVVARTLVDLVDLLLSDMEEEERLLLDPRLLALGAIAGKA